MQKPVLILHTEKNCPLVVMGCKCRFTFHGENLEILVWLANDTYPRFKIKGYTGSNEREMKMIYVNM